jgi:Tol biopolymer transport system component
VCMARGLMSVAVAAGLLAFAAPARATFPGANGSIVYAWVGESAYRAGPTATSIRAVDPRTGIVRVLKDCPLRWGPPAYTDCSVSAPRSSPDGQSIAFPVLKTTPDFTGAPWQADPAIAVMSADGSSVQEHPTQYRYWALAWAPTGDRLLLQRNTPTGYSASTATFVATLDGKELDQATPTWSGAADWSSKGQIAYVRDRNADPTCSKRCLDIFLTRPGSAPRRLTYRGGATPSWSPNGTKLAFSRSAGPGRADIHVIRRDGSGRRRLTRRGGYAPAWSPDGKWIAFVRFGDLYVMRAAGGGLRRLVDSPYGGLDGPQVTSVDWQAAPRLAAQEY